MTAMRRDDTTAGEVVDGICAIVEGGIEFEERDVGGALFRSKDEANALGERLAEKILLITTGVVTLLENLYIKICLVRIKPCACVFIETDTADVRLICKGIAVRGACRNPYITRIATEIGVMPVTIAGSLQGVVGCATEGVDTDITIDHIAYISRDIIHSLQGDDVIIDADGSINLDIAIANRNLGVIRQTDG